MTLHRVFLVPGFFGFANLGDFFYFQHLVDFFEERFAAAGLEVHVVRVHTHPTASLTVRARKLADTIASMMPAAGASEEVVAHLVGHSAGGLDARLLMAPGSPFGQEVDLGPIRSRVKSVLTVATPHRGTPLSAFFATRFGGPALRLFSLLTLYVLKFGGLPLSVLIKFGSLLTKADDRVGFDNSIVDQIFRELLDDFSKDRRQAVERFFRDVTEEESSIITQTTPAAMELFHAGTSDPEGVKIGSIVTRARAPGLRGVIDVGINPYAQVTRALYSLLHDWASKPPMGADLVDATTLGRLIQDFGEEPEAGANDGVIPTYSQPWGEVVAAASADHLDIIGHFKDPHHQPPHVDWLATGTGFDRACFEDVWSRAVEWMLAGSGRRFGVDRGAARPYGSGQ